MTNADRIRAMDDMDLAKNIAEIADCVACETIFEAHCRCHHEFFSCWQAWTEWLQQEAEEEARGRVEDDAETKTTNCDGGGDAGQG